MKCPVLENVERLKSIVDEKFKGFLPAWYLLVVKKALEIEREFPLLVCLKTRKCEKMPHCEEVINKIKGIVEELTWKN